MPRTAKQFADEIDGLWKRAEAEGRDLTPAERIHVSGLVAEAKPQLEMEKSIREIGLQLGGPGGEHRPDGSRVSGGPGDVFVKSAAYQKIMDPSGRGQSWTTGPVEVSSMQLVKGTILKTGVGGPGGGLVPPQYEPGVVSKLFEPLGVSDVFGQSQTNASQVRYVNEGTATSAAAGVAEGGVKPESTIAMSEVVEPVKKIATVLPISDELLEDAPSIQSLSERQVDVVRPDRGGAAATPGGGHGRADRAVLPHAGHINPYTKLAADDNRSLAR